MTTYKLHNALPADTKEGWVNFLKRLYETSVIMKVEGRKLDADTIRLYNTIAKKFKVKTF